METDAQRALLDADIHAQRARRYAYIATACSVAAIALALIALVAAIVSAI